MGVRGLTGIVNKYGKPMHDDKLGPPGSGRGRLVLVDCSALHYRALRELPSPQLSMSGGMHHAGIPGTSTADTAESSISGILAAWLELWSVELGFRLHLVRDGGTSTATGKGAETWLKRRRDSNEGRSMWARLWPDVCLSELDHLSPGALDQAAVEHAIWQVSQKGGHITVDTAVEDADSAIRAYYEEHDSPHDVYAVVTDDSDFFIWCDRVVLLSGNPFLTTHPAIISRQTVIDSVVRKAEKEWQADKNARLCRRGDPRLLCDIAMLMGNDSYSVWDRCQEAWSSGKRCVPVTRIICMLLDSSALKRGWIHPGTGTATPALFDSLGSGAPPVRWETYTRYRSEYTEVLVYSELVLSEGKFTATSHENCCHGVSRAARAQFTMSLSHPDRLLIPSSSVIEWLAAGRAAISTAGADVALHRLLRPVRSAAMHILLAAGGSSRGTTKGSPPLEELSEDCAKWEALTPPPKLSSLWPGLGITAGGHGGISSTHADGGSNPGGEELCDSWEDILETETDGSGGEGAGDHFKEATTGSPLMTGRSRAPSDANLRLQWMVQSVLSEACDLGNALVHPTVASVAGGMCHCAFAVDTAVAVYRHSTCLRAGKQQTGGAGAPTGSRPRDGAFSCGIYYTLSHILLLMFAVSCSPSFESPVGVRVSQFPNVMNAAMEWILTQPDAQAFLAKNAGQL